jgi:hypothetical protein
MIEAVRYQGDERYSFQGSLLAEVVRLVWYTPEGKTRRLCLHLRYPDGREDFAPLSEAIERGFLR